MSRTIIWRVVSVVPTLLGVTFIVFIALHLIPGNPGQILLYGTNATPADVARLDHQLGLDRPLWLQYVSYLNNLIRGNLGYSYVSSMSVRSLVTSYLPYTITLTIGGMTVALVVGISLGILAGLRRDGIADRVAMFLAVIGTAIPYFWLALLLVMIFAVDLRIFPALGTGGLNSLILPSVALGIGYAAIITRLLRNKIIEIYESPHVLVARAKGIRNVTLIANHVVRNSISAVLAVIGLQIASMVAGAVTIEVIFGRPGLGSLLVQSISNKDIPTVQGIVLIVAVAYVVLNLLVDLLQAALDPRIRKAGI